MWAPMKPVAPVMKTVDLGMVGFSGSLGWIVFVVVVGVNLRCVPTGRYVYS